MAYRLRVQAWLSRNARLLYINPTPMGMRKANILYSYSLLLASLVQSGGSRPRSCAVHFQACATSVGLLAGPLYAHRPLCCYAEGAASTMQTGLAVGGPCFDSFSESCSSREGSQRSGTAFKDRLGGLASVGSQPLRGLSFALKTGVQFVEVESEFLARHPLLACMHIAAMLLL